MRSPSTIDWRSFFFLNLAMMLDRADQQLLPAVFLEVCQDLHVGPSFLGTIMLCRGLAMSLVGLAAGPLSRSFDRITICFAGITLWAIATASVGAAPSVGWLLVGRTFNGLGLGLVIPVLFALVADMFPPEKRGAAFGALTGGGNLGGLLGALLATEMASSTVLGVPGWRVACRRRRLARGGAPAEAVCARPASYFQRARRAASHVRRLRRRHAARCSGFGPL